MKNNFIAGCKYAAAQNISKLSLSKGNAPLFYEELIFVKTHSSDNFIEHEFTYFGEPKWFDDEFINNGKVEDNGMCFAQYIL